MEEFQERCQTFVKGLSERYEPFVRQHLSMVYMVLAGATACTTIGATAHIIGFDMGLAAALGSLILVLGLHFYQDNGKNFHIRLAMLFAFAFCSGQTLGPLMRYIISVNPIIILIALIGTFITFATLSLAAMLAERGKYLFLGGVLGSVVNTMAIVSLCNIFFQAQFVQVSQLYFGVFLMCAFIVFDTQNIVEKCRAGNKDVVQHALDLFFDVLSLFRRLLIILTQRGDRKRKQCEKTK